MKVTDIRVLNYREVIDRDNSVGILVWKGEYERMVCFNCWTMEGYKSIIDYLNSTGQAYSHWQWMTSTYPEKYGIVDDRGHHVTYSHLGHYINQGIDISKAVVYSEPDEDINLFEEF